MKTRNIFGWIARIVIGLVFLASAVTKYISIDAFEQFVYEHQLFSWTMTTVLTRLLIACEFALGALLLIGLYPKTVKTLIIAFLAGFSIYILLKPAFFNVSQENCHCFGTVLILNDTQTLIKNVVLLLLSVFLFWNKGIATKKHSNEETKAEPERKNLCSWIKNNQAYCTFLVCLASVMATMLITMPDFLQYKLNGRAAKINETKFTELVNHEVVQPLEINTGKKIVCMYSAECKFCKRTAMRFEVMRQKYSIDDKQFAIIFWGRPDKIQSFFANTKAQPLPYVVVDPRPFLAATKGRQPIVILTNNGKVEKVLKYNTLTDEEITKFLGK